MVHLVYSKLVRKEHRLVGIYVVGQITIKLVFACHVFQKMKSKLVMIFVW